MPYCLEALVVDRVDLVDEGANSEAFMTLYKRKESSMTLEEILAGLKPEHATVAKAALADKDAELAKATTDITELTARVDELTKSLEAAKAKKNDGDNDEDDRPGHNGQDFDEDETMKAMPAEARNLFKSMQNKLVAAEAAIKKAADEKLHADAVAKAATLKALPVATDKLVELVKGAKPELLEVLDTVAKALETTTLGEVGKTGGDATFSKSASDAWGKIEKAAGELAKANGYTLQKGITEVIASQPELYQEYLDGGAN